MDTILNSAKKLVILSTLCLTLNGCSTIARAVIAMSDQDMIEGKSSLRRNNMSSTAGGFFEDVKPWQKAKLSRKEMQRDPDVMGTQSQSRAMGTREAFSGASCTGMGSFGCR